MALRSLLLVMLPALAGCTSFANVRSADVRPGPSITAQASFTTPPGDEAAWFWSYDCGAGCNRGIHAFDLTLAWGHRPTAGPPFTLGVGVTGIAYPYVEAYAQLRRHTRHPFGVGGRLGLPADGWSEHRLYARWDAPVAPDVRFLLNPGLFVHTGNSPNGENPGSFIGLVGGVGLEIGSGPITLTPALALVQGRAARRSYGVQREPATQTFAALSLALSLRRGGSGR